MKSRHAPPTCRHRRVPLAEMFGYANAIRSLSKGRADYTMTPARFEPVPLAISRLALSKRKA